MLNTFKITSFLEGVSYILLLFIAVPVKYIGGNEFLVKALGMPHGILFLTYIVLALLIRDRMKWGFTNTFIVLVASVIPFGTFYVNERYVREK